MKRREFFRYIVFLSSLTSCGTARKRHNLGNGFSSDRFAPITTVQKIKTPKKVIIVGGGLSGLTAGIHLIERGFEVEIFEKSSACGGKLSSYRGLHSGCNISLEHGFHAWWGQYHNLIDMMRKLNIERNLKEIPSVKIRVRGMSDETIHFKPRVYPFFLLFPILFSKNISFREMMDSLYIGTFILRYDKKSYDQRFDNLTINDLKERYDIPENIQKIFFEPFIKAGFFADPQEVSAASFLEFFHFYLSGNINDFKCYHIGGDPQEKVIEPMMRYFLDRGGKINFNSEIENLKFSDYKVKGIQQRLDRIYVYRYDGVIHILQNIPAEKSFFSREIPVNEIPEESYTKVELKQYRALFIGFFDDELIIISGECTHAGCSLNWDGVEKRFLCPCHGGQFSKEGNLLKGPPNIPLIVFRVNLSAVAQAGEGIPEFPDTEQPVIHKGDYFIIASDIPGIQGILNNVTGDIDLPVLWQTGEERGDEFKKILNLNTNSCIVIRIWFNKSVKPDRIPVGFTSGFKFITVYFLLSRLNDDIRECSRKTAAQCIEFIISGTPEFKNASDEEIIELITPEIIELFPELKGAATIYHHIIRHDNYTSFNKGALSLRPSVQSVFTNLFYSGDWVYLDIPVFFMERAVMTAKIAVNYILSREGITPNRIYLPEVKGILSSV